MLRYEAVLEPAAATGAQQAQQRLVAVDRERRFVVSFYMADQTLAVYEPVLPNSGLQGGKFLERARVYKNGSKLVRAGRGASPGAGCRRLGAVGEEYQGGARNALPAGIPACLPACLPTAPHRPPGSTAGLVHRGRREAGGGAGPARPPLPPCGRRRVH